MLSFSSSEMLVDGSMGLREWSMPQLRESVSLWVRSERERQCDRLVDTPSDRATVYCPCEKAVLLPPTCKNYHHLGLRRLRLDVKQIHQVLHPDRWVNSTDVSYISTSPAFNTVSPSLISLTDWTDSRSCPFLSHQQGILHSLKPILPRVISSEWWASIMMSSPVLSNSLLRMGWVLMRRTTCLQTLCFLSTWWNWMRRLTLVLHLTGSWRSDEITMVKHATLSWKYENFLFISFCSYSCWLCRRSRTKLWKWSANVPVPRLFFMILLQVILPRLRVDWLKWSTS